MRVGLLADTHDRVPAIAEFAGRFREAGVEMVLHAGDYCSPFALRPLIAAAVPLAGVFGRNDGDHQGLLAEASQGVGVELYGSPHSVQLSGTRLLLVYDVADINERAIGEHSIVVHGFTHKRQIKTTGDTLLINPGEACGWLFGPPSAAILDLETRHVEFLTLEGSAWTR